MKLGQKAQEKQSLPNHKVFPWQKKLFKAQVLGLSFQGLFECELALIGEWRKNLLHEFC